MSPHRCPRRVNRRLSVVAAAVALLVSTGSVASAAISPAPARTWGTNGRVLAVLPVGDRVYIAGDFTSVIDPSSRTYPASRLAVYIPSTGRFDLGWSASADASVSSLAISSEKLFVGGSFTTMNGIKRKKLARLDASTGTLDPSWSASVDRPPDALATSGDQVYVAGAFTKAAGTGATLTNRPYVAKFSASTGAIDAAWLPTPNERVRTVRTSDDGSFVYIGGSFTSVNGAFSVGRVAKLTSSTGSLVAGFVPGATNQTSKPPVYDLWVSGSDRVYVAVGGSGGACAAMNATTGSVLWSKHSNGNLQSVRVIGDTVFCGGHFTGVGGFDNQTRYKLASVDRSTGTTLPFAPVVNSALGVWSMGADSTRLYIGGDFTQIDTTAQPGFAAFVDDSARTAPTSPESLVAAPGDSTVLLHWDAPSTDGGSALTRYRIYRSDNAGVAWSQIATSTAPDFVDGSAQNDTSYLYRVTASNVVGEGTPSASAAARPSSNAATTPGAPSRFTAVGQYASNRLSWIEPSSGGSAVTAYAIYRGSAAGSSTLLTTVPAGQTTFADGDVVIGTRYYYRVSAINAVGEGDRSVEQWAVPTNGVPTPPTLSATTEPGASTLSWVAPARDGGSPVTQYVLVRDSIRIAVLPASQLSYVDRAVQGGTTYSYRIKAQNVNGTSPLSVPLLVTAR